MLSNISLPRSDENDLPSFVLAAFAVELFMIIFYYEHKVYDLATAAAFALLLGCLARRKLLLYCLIFPIACLNRETMFLMIPIFALYAWQRLSPRVYWAVIGYQAACVALTRIALMIRFAHNPGFDIGFRFSANLQLFAEHPWLSVVHWVTFLIVTGLCLWHWRRKAILLRMAFLVLAPSLLILYLLVGQSFEIRVFAELYPIVFALIPGVVQVR